MDITYQYTKLRCNFGRQPLVCEQAPELCDSVGTRPRTNVLDLGLPNLLIFRGDGDDRYNTGRNGYPSQRNDDKIIRDTYDLLVLTIRRINKDYRRGLCPWIASLRRVADHLVRFPLALLLGQA
ncbi:hypothetical protein K1T71_002242 [Dendrolimus kikuchii]|uniref:Uncharacterized protein n=1 Tax=Dendrolimus kikuchii TaxID=765133 RepID=A0ACC1DCH5_9NEOP|nr:hypothetical protein K1T71_002242 [Dendrolimus kikuchii]